MIGWLDDSTVLFGAAGVPPSATTGPPRPGRIGTVAWNVDTDELWRGPYILPNETVAIAFP